MVYLLSVDEAKQYFANENARICYPTSYAKNNGAWTNDNGAGWWWLRSPGSYSSSAALVDLDGYVFTDGDYVNSGIGMVRPVVVLSLGL